MFAKLVILSFFANFALAQGHQAPHLLKMPLEVVICAASDPVIPYVSFISQHLDPSLIQGDTWEQKLSFVLDELTLENPLRAEKLKKLLPELLEGMRFTRKVNLTTEFKFPLFLDICHAETLGLLNYAATLLEPSLIIDQDLWDRVDEHGKSILVFQALVLKEHDYHDPRSVGSLDMALSYVEFFREEVMGPFKERSLEPWAPQRKRRPIPIPNIDLKNPKVASSRIISDSNFAFIKGGKFDVVSLPDPYSSFARRFRLPIFVSNSFEIQATPVTQSQWFFVMGSNLSAFNRKEFCPLDFIEINGTLLCPNNPVENVSIYDIREFIKRVNMMDARYTYDLPMEYQWEHAVRDGADTYFWFGNDLADMPKYSFGNDDPRYGNYRTHPVMQKPANGNGLYDIYSIREWMKDVWRDGPLIRSCESSVDSPGKCKMVFDPYHNLRIDPRSSDVVVRGAGSKETRFQADLRTKEKDDDYLNYVGFRLTRTRKQ